MALTLAQRLNILVGNARELHAVPEEFVVDDSKNVTSNTSAFLTQLNESGGLAKFKGSAYEAEMLNFYDGVVSVLEKGEIQLANGGAHNGDRLSVIINQKEKLISAREAVFPKEEQQQKQQSSTKIQALTRGVKSRLSELHKSNSELEGEEVKLKKQKLRQKIMARGGMAFDALALSIAIVAVVAVPPMGVLIAGVGLAGAGAVGAIYAVKENKLIEKTEDKVDKIKGKIKLIEKNIPAQEKQKEKNVDLEKVERSRAVKRGVLGFGKVGDVVATVVTVAAFIVAPPAAAAIAIVAATVAGASFISNVSADAMDVIAEGKEAKKASGEGKVKEKAEQPNVIVEKSKEKPELATSSTNKDAVEKMNQVETSKIPSSHGHQSIATPVQANNSVAVDGASVEGKGSKEHQADIKHALDEMKVEHLGGALDGESHPSNTSDKLKASHIDPTTMQNKTHGPDVSVAG